MDLSQNVYPAEVEAFLKTNQKIEDAQVFGVPCKRMGEEVAVWIQLKESEIMTVDEVKSFCKGQVIVQNLLSINQREMIINIVFHT